MDKKIELLAPAGNYRCFKAAIMAGADAVYLGLNKYGARASADNFTIEELKMAIDEAHLFGCKVYLTVNTLFKENETKDLFDFLYEPYISGLDGVIVQDLGVVSIIRKLFKDLEVHASTQMAITDASGAIIAEKLGMTRVVPARELSLKEIRNIREKTNIELECFIHGAMCYSYSGKCLMSSFIGGRSGNRGRCAQPCRLKVDNEYLLSMKDMCTLNIIDKLIDAGIYSFKIEGRMKSEDYVYEVTRIYRKYIDMYLKTGKLEILPDDYNKLIAVYTREGNCEGYYFEKNGRDMITISSPSYKSEKNVLNEINLDKKISVDIFACIKTSESIYVSIEIKDKSSIHNNISYYYTSDIVPQIANKKSATVEQVRKQLSKLGNTPFKLSSIDIELDDGLFIASGQLNELRRRAVEGLLNVILSEYRRNPVDKSESTETFLSVNEDEKNTLTDIVNDRSINIFCMDEKQVIYGLKYDFVNGIILNYDMFDALFITKSKDIDKSFYDKLRNGVKLYIKLPYIIREDKRCFTENKLIDFLETAIAIYKQDYNADLAGVYVSNLESIHIIRDIFPNLNIIGDVHLYSLNKEAHEILKELGVKNSVMPIELNKKELLDRNIKNEEIIVYGRVPTMISTQCINKTKGMCKNYSLGRFTQVSDRKNKKLPVYIDCQSCTNVIYNSVPTMILNEGDFINRIRPCSLRIDFTNEDKNEVDMIMCNVESYLNDNLSENLDIDYTRGHLNRGVE